MKRILTMKSASVLMLLLFLVAGTVQAQSKKQPVELPGKYQQFTLLPNGWRLTPVGKQVPIGELPLNMVVTKNQRYAITSNSGMGVNSLSVIDLKTEKEIQRYVLSNTWVGLTFGPHDKRLYVSGGNDNCVYVFSFQKGKLMPADTLVVGPKFPKGKISLTGLAFDKRQHRLLAVSQKSNSLYIIDLKNKQVLKKVPMPGKCYDVRINHAGTYAYISVWGKAKVVEFDLNSDKITKVYPTGDHPNDMVISRNDNRLFVTNANNNSVTVLDLKNKTVSETLQTSLIPDAPYGSTPDALALSPDGEKLIVANADNNYLAVFNVEKPGYAKNLGFIPVGWYPTAVQYLKKGRILVANGKGISSRANPDGPNPEKRRPKNWQENYTGTMFKGTLSIFSMPDNTALSKLSKTVYDNTPFIKKVKETYHESVIPAKHTGKASDSIRYVFYIIRENRTYDQVLGDMSEGNGDTALCLFGKKITPNAHRLSTIYTLYDNFYADAEISADGHNWSTAAYATDYVEKLWPVNYGHRGASYDFEGGVPAAAPSSGYIWNNVLSHGKTFRNYGEFLNFSKKLKGPFYPRDSILMPYTCNAFPGFNLSFPDLKRYKIWAHDFDSLVKAHAVPNLTLMRLPNDHCWGTRPGKPTPVAYVARNDYALGLLVDKISHSPIWKNSIIFVVEDDAQNGPDHVDAHRSVLLVIGPHVKRHFVDHTMYSTSGVLKTIELILGLPPMTQYDLAAHPILHSITDTAWLKPYTAIKPSVDMNAKNKKDAYGAKLSEKLNFSREDAIPDGEYNKIIWKAVKGAQAVVPAPVHSAFVNEKAAPDDDDD
ncbi:beta-propeller fold lactonase family protein [Candidatus Sulfidibacterium hydrothermale]|uniref:bifunctional YncE family protein/alkaline phosphatase family protein n=1 Tax=Candidatus Sulfidibacterium hydrothermale TaxID=2875962 RepID=UPI001F0AAC56|nr:bifunctional YncE family protein/alkaline phosphatase family protein [Candidatus Sulfidibacterium hydrothermale]UBM62919.1 beta-propeller fold lactonase family protein [Candidatus Sulfidibacterium hydrothermale]